MRLIKFINWNIANPSAEKFQKQLRMLVTIDADILVLTESGDKNKNERMKIDFEACGYTVHYNENYIDKYSTIILTKKDIDAKLFEINVESVGSRTVGVEVILNGTKVTIIGSYFPANNRKIIEKKKQHVDEFFDLLKICGNQNLIVAGDFNSVKRDHFPKFNWFRKWEYEIFDRLESIGLNDICIGDNLDPLYSWYGNHNIGHLYDYIYSVDNLVEKVVEFKFDRSVIDLKLSDHAMQYVEMRF